MTDDPQEGSLGAAATARRGHSVAVIPGDGIGPEVIAAGREVIDAAAHAAGVGIEWISYDWGSALYRVTGRMMPEDGLDLLAEHDAVYFGAVGDPGIPDHITVWGLILPIRKRFDQFVNYRPVRWLPGVPARLAGRLPHEVDMLFVRENVEGEYMDIGERSGHAGDEVVTQTARFTRRGIERVTRYAFERARERRRHLTSVTKSNALKHSMVFWDEVVAEVAGDYPDVGWRPMHVDAAAYEMVMEPGKFDVVVASNLFGDILTDLGAALQGSLGLAASANLTPRPGDPSAFEPVHGSAPNLAGRNVANPAGAIWAGALMLDDLGAPGAARAVMDALERTIAARDVTQDLGGSLSTTQFTNRVIAAMKSPNGDDHDG